MEEHPGGDCAIERLVLELEACASPTRASTPRARASSTMRSDWSTATTSAELARHPLGELSFATPDLDDPARPSIPDCGEHNLTRVEPLSGRVRALSRGQSRLVRVLLADELGIVQPHGSTIGVPGIPRRGAFPPSHAFTVAPTSANSPSWTWPRAFRPST